MSVCWGFTKPGKTGAPASVAGAALLGLALLSPAEPAFAQPAPGQPAQPQPAQPQQPAQQKQPAQQQGAPGQTAQQPASQQQPLMQQPPRHAPAPALPAVEAEPDPWEVGSSFALDLDVRVGYAGRLDDPPLYRARSGGGLMFGAGADLFLSQRLSVGLGYEHIDLPGEESGLTPIGTVRLTRDLNSTWTRLRLYPLRTDVIGTYLAIGAALSWQSVGVSGSVWPAARPDQAQQLSCQGAGSVSFALRGESGVDLKVGDATRVQVAGTFAGYRLTDGVLGQCAPGAGSATMMSLRLALVYGWELS